MSLPALSKVSRFQVNNTVAANATKLTQNQNLLFALHTAIIGGGSYTDLNNAALVATNPATIVASCDSSTFSMAGVNKWVASTNLVWGTSSAHSWIVYNFAAMGLYLLLDANTTSAADSERLTIKVSHNNFSAAAGGTDGTTTTAPTALNSVTLVTVTNWGAHSALGNASVLHVIAAQDGTSFNAIICRNSFAVAQIHLAKPVNARSGWTHPYAAFWFASSSSAADITSFANVCQTTSGISGIANAGTSIVLLPASTGTASAMLPTLLTSSDAFSGDYPIFEHIWACGTAGSASAYLGLPPDLWFGTTGHVTGVGYPSAAVDATHPRQFLKFGPWVYPWNNSIGVFA